MLLFVQLCLNHFVETYDPTIEDSYRKQVLLDDQVATLEVLDTAGQEEYTALRDQWIRDGEGFILVYSITSKSSFSRIKNYFSQIQRVKDDEPFSLILVGNKLDRDAERQVSIEEGQELAQELGNVPFFECSAKRNVNIESAFFTAARKCRLIRNPDQAARLNPLIIKGMSNSASYPPHPPAPTPEAPVANPASSNPGNGSSKSKDKASKDGKKKKKGCLVM